MSGGGPRGPMGAGAMGLPPARASDFRGTLRRLVTRLLRDRALVWTLVAFGVVGTSLSVVGPRILGHATDIVFTGYLSDQFPDGSTKAQVVAELRDSGRDKLAALVSSVDLEPGSGIDFRSLTLVLAGVLVLY